MMPTVPSSVLLFVFDNKGVSYAYPFPFRVYKQRVDIQFLQGIPVCTGEISNAYNGITQGVNITFCPAAVTVQQFKGFPTMTMGPNCGSLFTPMIISTPDFNMGTVKIPLIFASGRFDDTLSIISLYA